MFSDDADCVVVEGTVKAVAIDISQDKFTQASESLAARFEAINALYAEMLGVEKKWREAFSELDQAVKGLASDEERWAFVTALAQLNARNMRVMAAEKGSIEDVFDYRYGEEWVGESMQTSWDHALDLNLEALREILGESEEVEEWLATLEEPSVVRVVNGRSRKSVLHWRPGDEPVVINPGRIGAKRPRRTAAKTRPRG